MSDYSTCYSAPNNYNLNFPALMSDSRIWSSWSPDAVINQKIQQKEGIQSNWNYRQYLQQNGLKIMQFNNDNVCYESGIENTINNYTDKYPGDNVPYKFKGVFDSSRPGNNSDLKNPYLTREQLNSRLIAPSINPDQFRK